VSHSEEPESASELSFSRLIRKAKQGDRRAFDLCVQDVRRRIRSLCIQLLNGIEAEGDQATQDTLVRAWQKLDTLRLADTREDVGGEKRRFESWLMRIATNVCYNITRTLKWKKESTGPRMVPEVLELFLPPDPGFERAMFAEDEDNAERFRRMILECGSRAKPRWDALDLLIFYHYYEQGIKTVVEVAVLVGRHRDTVTDRLMRRIRPVLEAVRLEIMREEEKKETDGDEKNNDG
jgi:DNA-directed RNA polymerase specialized sigma24 family protein